MMTAIFGVLFIVGSIVSYNAIIEINKDSR